ncbi:MAG TPA: DNA polymerase III subunit delta, partial [Anaerovoracaceae bacterium]|nr:DNA polymerase III subunit delta [Anaerovoracaceae bacterium]
EFIEYVKSLPESCTLILVSNNADKRKRIYKAIAASGGCYEFDRLNDTDICAFVKKRLRQEGKRAKISLIRKMVEMTGYFDKKSNYTLYNLDNDIKKLIAHSEGSEISQHDLDVSLSQNTESYVFHMIDAISQNKKDVALTILHNLLYSGENWQKLLALICSGYELMLMVKEMLDQGLSQRDIKEQIGVHEYRIKIAARLSLQYSIKRIKQIICSCFDVDRNIKTGLLDERLALELLIASI